MSSIYRSFADEQQIRSRKTRKKHNQGGHQARRPPSQRPLLPGRAATGRSFPRPLPLGGHGRHLLLRGGLQLRPELPGVRPERIPQVPAVHRVETSDGQVAGAHRPSFRVFRERTVFRFYFQGGLRVQARFGEDRGGPEQGH